MKALTTGPSMYPGATFSSRFLLCLVLLSFSGSTVHGNNYQQDAQKAWKNLSQILLSTDTYEKNDQAPLAQNGSSKLPTLLDENNIMHTEHLSNDDTDYVNYSEEYEQEPAHPAELKSMLRPTSLNNLTISSATAESPTFRSLSNSSGELDSQSDEKDLDQYETYYYYDEYDNNTSLEHRDDGSNDTVVSEEIKTSSSTEEPTYIHSDPDTSSNHSAFYDNFSDSELYDSDEGTSMESSNKHLVVASNLSNKLPDKSILIGEAVVSVVTTKSVVNGTISIPVTPLPQTTEQISSPLSPSDSMDSEQLERHQTTENSIVLASVQTSRSISGARFLPFPVVEQVVQVAPNVNKDNKVSGTLESTESIIDKLDRVQSELSSGFLSGGFRNSGNTLQLDVMGETETTTKRRTSTMRSPVITKFVPHRPNTNRKPLASLKPVIPTISKFNRNETRLNNTFSTTMRSVPIRPHQLRPPVDKTSGNDGKGNIGKLKSIVVQDVSAFLPPGYNIDKAKSEPTEKSIIDDIFAKAKVDISAFLPPGFENKQNATSDQKKNEKAPVDDIIKKSQVDLSSLLPPGYKPKTAGDAAKQPHIDDLFAVSKVDLSSLLPPGFNLKKGIESNGKNDTEKKVTNQENSTTEATVSTTKTAGFKVVFPSRPGGRKPITRITTPSTLHGNAPGAFKPAIHKGWPTRATTEFTGWPTSSTTPISIEKLLEAARTATAQSSNTSSTTASSMTSSTTTTTTTTTTPRPTTPGTCEEECELAGTIRLVGKRPWVPELLDSNTVEWKELANEVEQEINSAFAKSSGLKKWYKKIKIDSFSQGSILVDYFVELNDIGKKINTQELKSIFHESLNPYVSNNENSTEAKNLLVLGEFTIDPASTDFVVVPKSVAPQQINNGNAIIPQWAIAVIVIGVGGLLFIIVFGVSVLMNRQNVSKIKPKMPTIFDEERDNNIIHKSQASPGRRSLDYPKEDLYNIDADWNDKSFDSTSNKMMVDGPYYDSSRYNLHDSWKSEWNGYYYNASHASNRSPGYGSTTAGSRHHPDYDTNF